MLAQQLLKPQLLKYILPGSRATAQPHLARGGVTQCCQPLKHAPILGVQQLAQLLTGLGTTACGG